MFDQKGTHDHAHAIVHPPCGPEFTHAGIDHRVTGLAFLPGAKQALVFHPGESLELGTKRAIGGIRKMMQEVMGKLPPTQLSHVARAHQCGGTHTPGLESFQEAMINLCWSDFSKMQVGRKT